MEINQNIDIKDLKKESIHITDEPVLKISFVLTINYSENYAKLEFEGNIITIPTKEEFEECLTEWKKNIFLAIFLFVLIQEIIVGIIYADCC